MTYSYRLTFSYAHRATRLERARMADAAYDRLRSTWTATETVWNNNPHGPDQRRDACLAVLAPLVQFTVKIGATQFARERLNDILVAFDELHAGRHSVLLAPAPVHPGTWSMTDLTQQAVAQVCVEILRQAGFSAGDARKKTSGFFEKHKLPKFSESKLRAIGSRLTGPGSTQDPAYDLYEWAKSHTAAIRAELGNVKVGQFGALKLVERLVQLTKHRDHRRDFFFAPRENSSELR